MVDYKPAMPQQTMYVREPVTGTGCVVIEDIETEDVERCKYGFHRGSLTSLKSSYPLKIMVPSHVGSRTCKWIFPITFGGGLVGGDRIEMEVHVMQNCSAVVTGQESTKVYHCEEGLCTSQVTRGTVGEGALLCVLSDPVVCYRDSNFLQEQVFQMSANGNLVYLDWLIGGRVALGELWDMYSYQNKTDIVVDGSLVYRDNYNLQRSSFISIQDSLGSFQVKGSCILLGQKLETVSNALTEILGRKKSIGEKFDSDLICSVSPLMYSINQSKLKGVYIRFLASTSTKAYNEVISHIVKHLSPMIGGNPFAEKY